ncbi:MAG: hypothetical protein RBS73_07130 [Prolixibacteraceae bacterium]|jgi:hypothetical protein|nr:hypothetical protein [Prolixibacteraceae bacterium]
MKQFTLLVIFALACQIALAGNKKDQDDYTMGTLFNQSRNNGGYGALSLNYSQIDHKDAFIMGARGAWVIDHSLALGLGGYGFINGIDTDYIFENDHEYDLAGGYGGLFLEPILFPRLPVHISVPVLFGIGGIAFVDNYNDWDDWYFDDDQSDVFLVLEPGVELEFNMSRHFRMAASLSYRFTSDIELEAVNSDVLEGLTVGLVFKFGKF